MPAGIFIHVSHLRHASFGAALLVLWQLKRNMRLLQWQLALMLTL